MSAMRTIKRGRVVTAGFGVLSAWACTVANKSDYTFTDTPGTGGSSSAGKGTGGSTTAGKGGTSGEAGVMETGGTSGLGGRGGRGGRGALGGRGGKGGTAGQSGAAGEAGEGGAAATGGTSGNAGAAGESGAGGEAGMTSTGVCGDGHLDSGEQCDLGANNGVTACTYGVKSCTVCTKQCTRTAGTATYCGDGKRQSSHEQCDDGNTTTEGCPTYDDTACNACDSTCKVSVPRTCGDGSVNGDVLTSITVQAVAVYVSCTTTTAGYTMPYYLNGVLLPNVPQSLCTCTTNGSTVVTATIQDSAVLAAVRPSGNIFEVRGGDGSGAYTLTSWVKLTFNYADGTTFTEVPIDFGGQASSNGNDLCQNYQYYALAGSAFDVPRVEQCDDSTYKCISCGVPLTVSGFTGDRGPVFSNGWTQCEGYLDTKAGDELPATGWGSACKAQNFNTLRLVCGASTSTYRYIDVSKNFLRDGTVSFPDTGFITASADQNGTAFTITSNDVYAQPTAPVDSEVSWWGTGAGCDETDAGIRVDTDAACSWEVSNCFGQNLSGDRHFWVYMK